MSTEHIVSLLIAERDRLNKAIEALSGPTVRRGRPPKSASPDSPAAPAPTTLRRRRTFTAAQRKAQAEKMRAYWAKRKKAGK
jgi:hypothetical protein